jgi:hypothetical protein
MEATGPLEGTGAETGAAAAAIGTGAAVEAGESEGFVGGRSCCFVLEVVINLFDMLRVAVYSAGTTDGIVRCLVLHFQSRSSHASKSRSRAEFGESLEIITDPAS